MGVLGVVELQRPRQRLQHAVGDAAELAALELGVVGHAHPGEHGDLLASQAGDAPRPVAGQAGLLRRDRARGGR